MNLKYLMDENVDPVYAAQLRRQRMVLPAKNGSGYSYMTPNPCLRAVKSFPCPLTEWIVDDGDQKR